MAVTSFVAMTSCRVDLAFYSVIDIMVTSQWPVYL